MSEFLLRKLRAQVTIAMDATLRKAAFEIMSIFESTLIDHKQEMVEKEEMVAQLKLKLQVAELRLKDLQVEGPSTATANTTQAIPEIVPDFPKEVPVEKEIIPAPEIDFEVPDDWCAPLGTELLAKQDEVPCPSVRLREFSIPLCHVPIVKKESVDHVGSPQITSRRKSRRLSHTSEIPQPAPSGVLRGKGSRMQNEIRLLFKQLHQEDFLDISNSGLRKSRRLEEGERKKGRSSAPSVKKIQACQGPQKTSRKKTQNQRQRQKEDVKEDLGWTQPLEDAEDNLNDVISKKQDSKQKTEPKEIGKKLGEIEEITYQSCGVQSKDGYICSVCQKVTKTKFNLIEHYRIHTGEKPYSCSVCSRNFRFRSQYYCHLKSYHKSEINPN